MRMPAPRPAARPLLLLLLLAEVAARPKPCYSHKKPTTDAWCTLNCHASIRNCPSDVCHCGGIPPARKAKAAHHAPTTAAHVKQSSKPSQTKPKSSKIKYCRSISPASTSAWCNTNCHAKIRLCPSDMCLCDDKPPPPGGAHPKPHHTTHHSAAYKRTHGHTHHSAAYKRKHHSRGKTHHYSGPKSPVPPAHFNSSSATPEDANQWQPQAGSRGQCAAMTAITGSQLQCTFPLLDSKRAAYYAKAASERMGGLLGTSCAWAAFLGNVAIETKELTLWKEINCRTSPPWCGRGPLQLTSRNNYAFCSHQPSCNCPHILSDMESVTRNANVGFSTAACVWASLFGHSLSPFADGTRTGFLKTCCSIHQGHYPCQRMSQYQNRENYWRKASSCLGAPAMMERVADAQLHRERHTPVHALLPEDGSLRPLMDVPMVSEPADVEEDPPTRFVVPDDATALSRLMNLSYLGGYDRLAEISAMWSKGVGNLAAAGPGPAPRAVESAVEQRNASRKQKHPKS